MARDRSRRTTTKLPNGKPAIGRPQIILDQSIVEGLARLGCTNEEIASALSISDDTLTRRCAESLKKGRNTRKVSLRRSLDVWRDKHVGAMIFIAKNELGMSDNIKHEVTGEGGGPLRAESVVYIVSLPDNGRDLTRGDA